MTLRRVGCRLFCLRLRYRRRLRQNKRLYGYAGVVVHIGSEEARRPPSAHRTVRTDPYTAPHARQIH
jgi:hypothetical protein